jgi:hypothetical protein
MSNLSDKFVDSLAASMGFRIPPETKALYAQKLAAWKLSEKQWADAFNNLVKENLSGRMIPLGAIYSELQHQRGKNLDTSDMAWLYFESGGYDYAIRLTNVDGYWVYPASHRLAGKVPTLPLDAIKILTVPDNQAPPYPSETPSRAEVAALVAKTIAKIGGINAKFDR